MDRLQHLVVHRLPQYYQWAATGLTRSDVNSPSLCQTQPEVFTLFYCLDQNHTSGDEEIKALSELLLELEIPSQIIHLNYKLCLLVRSEDELAASCCWKNRGVAIATDL